MTHISGSIRTLTMTVVVVLSAAVASTQPVHDGHAPATGHTTLSQPPAQPSRGDHAMATMHKDMMARMAAEDTRLETLVADMNMLTGDLKIEAMAQVLTRLVKRQSMMRGQMMEMHDRMMRGMRGPTANAPSADPPSVMVSPDREPGDMCLPPTN